jgi:hypothetical protein
MMRNARSAARPAGRLLLLVLGLSLLFSACLFPPGRYGGYDRGLSRGQILTVAREAAHDFIIRRYGREARPTTAGPDIRTMNRNEAQVVGRISFYRSPRDRSRIRMYYRCVVDRFDGRVYGIDLY